MVTPTTGTRALDQLIYEYLRANALASDEDHRKIADILAAFEAAYSFSGFLTKFEMCSDEEARTIYSQEAERELVEASLRIALDDIEDQKLSYHPSLWPQVEESCMEKHEVRAFKIAAFFTRKRTGYFF